jgi:hypothetical protein
MRQRGKKSAASFVAINNVDGAPPRLTAPSGLNVRERVVFEALIAASDPRHFRRSDVPLLVAYVQSVLLSHKLGRDPRNIKAWETATRTMVALSTKLRLNPHTRTDPKVIARQPQLYPFKPPWQRGDGISDPTDAKYDSADDDSDDDGGKHGLQ